MSASALAFPAALPNDGYVDLCILKGKVGRIESAKIMTSVNTGKHYDREKVVPVLPLTDSRSIT